MTVIHWFRRDLRVRDNTALKAALDSGEAVIPIFIFDPAILDSRYFSSARMAFLYAGLEALRDAIAAHDGTMRFYRGDPLAILPQIVTQTGASALYFNSDYTPYAQKRDQAVEDQLNIPVLRYHDAVIMEPGTVLSGANKPYTVYTPFKNKWRDLSRSLEFSVTHEMIGCFFSNAGNEHALPDKVALGISTGIELPIAGEGGARKRLERFLAGQIFEYATSRNELTIHPFNGSAGTSQLSLYFRLGMLSPREVVANARRAYTQAESDDAREGVTTWVDEIIWREFYMHIMAQFPHVYRGNFRSEYDNLEWDDNPQALQAWKDGMTGYPIVDAAMRQLKATGWIPNRARMIVSSFLTKHLLINWREGERHFMQHLLDGDPAANNGGWQWAAGTGTDAQPYFRIFNPYSQSKKFDPNGDYIRMWVPELADLSAKAIHVPHEIKQPPRNYPEPIVDHKAARERTLVAFKAAKEQEKK